MSLLSRKRTCLALTPEGVYALCREASKVRAKYQAPASSASGETRWQAPVNALQEALPQWEALRGEATVVLSSAFVRYAVVPHAGELKREDERRALAAAHFARVHGDQAHQWTVRVAPARHGGAALAAAVDEALLQALAQCFAACRSLRLASVQPHLMAAFNFWRDRLPEDGAWLVLAEPERTCIALLEGARWTAVSTLREGARHAADIPALLARASVKMAARGPSAVFATVAAEEALETPTGRRIEGLPFADDCGYAMARLAS